MTQINHLKFNKESLVYPGVYIPRINEQATYCAIKTPADKRKKLPATKVKELIDSYLVETPLPAAKREDFLVRAYGNQINIDVRVGTPGENAGDKDKNQDSNFFHFTRKVVLPEDADTEFVSGEYSCGVLRFHIPKICRPVMPRQSVIVIY